MIQTWSSLATCFRSRSRKGGQQLKPVSFLVTRQLFSQTHTHTHTYTYALKHAPLFSRSGNGLAEPTGIGRKREQGGVELR